ncbi:unnamed protein product, partial [Ectocarpus sp. 13 AM-2016]
MCHTGDGKGECDVCGSPMVFEKTRRKGKQAALRFNRDEKRADADDSSSNSDTESGEDSSSSDGGRWRRWSSRI